MIIVRNAEHPGFVTVHGQVDECRIRDDSDHPTWEASVDETDAAVLARNLTVRHAGIHLLGGWGTLQLDGNATPVQYIGTKWGPDVNIVLLLDMANCNDEYALYDVNGLDRVEAEAASRALTTLIQATQSITTGTP